MACGRDSGYTGDAANSFSTRKIGSRPSLTARASPAGETRMRVSPIGRMARTGPRAEDGSGIDSAIRLRYR